MNTCALVNRVRSLAVATRAAATLMLALIATPLAAQSRIARGYAATPEVSVRLYVPTGSVKVVAWDRDSIAVSGTMSPNASYFGGAGRGFAKIGVDTKETGDTLLAEADLTVMVPRRARVWLKMINGIIEADGTRGELELYTIGGRVLVQRAAGVVSIESIDAPVTVVESTDDLRVRGGKGLVTLRDLRGTASIATVSGAVDITGATAAAGRVETIGGAIRLGLSRYLGVLLELQTHAGDIVLDLDATRLPQLDLQSRTGKVMNAFPDGHEKMGRIVARSFKGSIIVR